MVADYGDRRWTVVPMLLDQSVGHFTGIWETGSEREWRWVQSEKLLKGWQGRGGAKGEKEATGEKGDDEKMRNGGN